MDEDYITIDGDALREDLINDSYGAAFGGGFGGALIEALDIENASDTEIVEIALSKNIDLRDYQI